MLEEKVGQEEAVQAASSKLQALEDFNEQLDGKVNSKSSSHQSGRFSPQQCGSSLIYLPGLMAKA